MIFPHFRHRAFIALAMSELAGMSCGTRAAEDPVAQFEREVKPLLEERCFK